MPSIARLLPTCCLLALLLSGCAALSPGPGPSTAAPTAVSADEAAVIAAFTSLGFYPARLAPHTIRLDLPTNDGFAAGSADLQAPMRRTLDEVAARFNSAPLTGWQMLVVGHADDRGSDADNLVMSQTRAANVLRHLVARGTDPARLRSEGRGEREPLVSNDKRYGRELNRRVELFLHQGALPAGVAAPR
jgi:outer membrane protein OmpA-like peptidoglycan-associated protein